MGEIHDFTEFTQSVMDHRQDDLQGLGTAALPRQDLEEAACRQRIDGRVERVGLVELGLRLLSPRNS